MKSEWREIRLDSIVDFLNAKRIPLSSQVRSHKQGKYPYYGASGIVDYLDDYIFDGKYLLISEDGENLNTRKTPIAFIAEGKYWVNNHAHILDEKEVGILEYLKYYFSTLNISPYITGAVQPKLNKGSLSAIPITLPPKNTRVKINKVLSTLDDKIELNRKMNQTLEEMAQALFKSWFVDFDPVHAKAKCSSDEELETAACELGISKEILDLFPSEFEESELGMIPKGWEIGHLGDKNFSMLIGSGINSFEGEKIYLATADVADTNITSQEILITYESRPSRANMQPVIGSVWFAKMQNSRKLLMFDNYSSTDSLILSTGFAGIKTTELSHCFIWSFIMSDAFNISKDNLADGAVQIAINNTSIKKINYTQPSDDILKLFTEKTSNLFRCKYQNDLEIQTLQKTRDTLLPKLLSGELDMSELDINVE